ncbi:MAG: hypothetical protein M3Q68_10585 [Actinomycetota bacterium]|nr:hypothetical protein [Actinomycetota bacterium]
MAPDAVDPEQALVQLATALADAVDEAIPSWVVRCVRGRLTAVPRHVLDDARHAGGRARDDVGVAVRVLLSTDVDDQRGNPLALLRTAVSYPTEVLLRAGATTVTRDKFSRERFPDDDFDLTPANWSDVDPSLQELGIAWGAAKAFVHKQRHRPS